MGNENEQEPAHKPSVAKLAASKQKASSTPTEESASASPYLDTQALYGMELLAQALGGDPISGLGTYLAGQETQCRLPLGSPS